MLLRRSRCGFMRVLNPQKAMLFFRKFQEAVGYPKLIYWDIFVGMFMLGYFYVGCEIFFSIDFGVQYLGCCRYVILTKMDLFPGFFPARRLFPTFQSAWEDFSHINQIPYEYHGLDMCFSFFCFVRTHQVRKTAFWQGWLPGFSPLFVKISSKLLGKLSQRHQSFFENHRVG